MTTTVTTLTGLNGLSGTYTLDPAHTRIGFVARHAMVTKVRGSFGTFEGSAVVDGTDLAASRVALTIEAASIDTGNEQRDAHLRSNDFLAMDEFPQITFTSTAVRQTGPDTLEITGDLTVRGTTRSVTVPFSLRGRGRRPVRQPAHRLRGVHDDQPTGLRRHVERPPRGRRRPGQRQGRPAVRRLGDQDRLTHAPRALRSM